MTDVDKVALWAGLIASIVGIVLSIVAIVLSIVSNNRATDVNDQTIKSLQKIESDVERVSDDTRTLIKAGWDKMLETVSGGQILPFDNGEHEADEEATPIDDTDETADEEPVRRNDLDNAARWNRLEEQIESLRKAVAERQGSSSVRPTASRDVERLLAKLSRLSPRAQALFQLLSKSKHMTQKQYAALRGVSLGIELIELRRAGLLRNFTGIEDGAEEPVFWLPGNYSRAAKVALQLASPVSSNVFENVAEELKKVGYEVRF